MVMFRINNKDYSNHVVGENYSVNRNDIAKTWDDINGTTHTQVIRQKVEGGFDMLFENEEQYNAFLEDLRAAKNPVTRAYSITVAINYPTNEMVSINAFISLSPVRDRTWDWKDIFRQFNVKISER